MTVLIIKAAALAVFFFWFFTICRMMYLGHRTDYRENWRPSRHERLRPVVNWTTAAMVVSAELVNILVRRRIGGETGTLFYVHLPAALLFVVSLIFLQANPGTIRPEFHRWTAKWLLKPSFVITSVTGPLLIVFM